MAEDLDTKPVIAVVESAEKEAPFNYMVREYDAEMPITFPTGAKKVEMVRPRQYGPTAGYERRPEEASETANMFLNEIPSVGTILEVGMPQGEPIYMEVREPLAKLNSISEISRPGVVERRLNSVFVQRMPNNEMTKKKVAEARTKEGAVLSFDATREEKKFEKTNELGNPANRPESFGITSKAVLNARRHTATAQ